MNKVAYNNVENKIVNIVTKKSLPERVKNYNLIDIDTELEILSKFSSNYTFNLLLIFQTAYVREIGEYKNYNNISTIYKQNILCLLSKKILKLIDSTDDKYIYGIFNDVTEIMLESILELIENKHHLKTEDEIYNELIYITSDIRHELFFDEPIPHDYRKVYLLLLQYINSYVNKLLAQMIHMYQVQLEGDENA